MKKIIIAALLTTVFTLESPGQGTVIFLNNSSTLFQYRDFSTGYIPTSVPAGGGRAELLWAPLGTTDLGLFQVLGATVTVNPGAGFIAGGTRTIPAGSGFSGIAPGADVSLVIRGWKGSASTWFDAMNTTFLLGYSDIFTVDTANPTSTPLEPPSSITGSGGFTGLVVGVPEPSSMALVGLGAAAILLRRRK